MHLSEFKDKIANIKDKIIIPCIYYTEIVITEKAGREGGEKVSGLSEEMAVSPASGTNYV